MSSPDSTRPARPTDRPVPAARAGGLRLAAVGLLTALVVGACAGAASEVGAPTAAGGAPSDRAPIGAAPSSGADASPVPGGLPASPTLRPTPGPTVPRVSPLKPPAYASRVVVPKLGIDLPVISGDLQPPPNYPFCDVAAYVTRFNQPYETGVTYISAHAQAGMFLPLLEASTRADGAELLGQAVEVYTSDGRRFDYRIERVVRHAVDYAVLNEIALDQRTLILQTSEGPVGTLEKLQVIAALEAEATVDVAVAAPPAAPRDCRPPELGASPSP
jgi:hypothetical protein